MSDEGDFTGQTEESTEDLIRDPDRDRGDVCSRGNIAQAIMKEFIAHRGAPKPTSWVTVDFTGAGTARARRIHETKIVLASCDYRYSCNKEDGVSVTHVACIEDDI